MAQLEYQPATWGSILRTMAPEEIADRQATAREYQERLAGVTDHAFEFISRRTFG